MGILLRCVSKVLSQGAESLQETSGCFLANRTQYMADHLLHMDTLLTAVELAVHQVFLQSCSPSTCPRLVLVAWGYSIPGAEEGICLC